MFRFLAGVATGWMLARAPPTRADVERVAKQCSNLLKAVMAIANQ
jgi:hypothetical protein